MNRCELFDSPDVELYFYGELADADGERVAAHVRTCAECRQRLDDLHAIQQALSAEPIVDAPPAGDWSGFMRRLDRSTETLAPSAFPALSRARRVAGSLRSRGSLARVAATLALLTIGALVAGRVARLVPGAHVDQVPLALPVGEHAQPAMRAVPAAAGLNPAAALREVSAEHLERSKLVVLGLATRDPHTTSPRDWQYERKLAATLLPETRLYRLAAQERGVDDVAHVMRDLETVLLEASMSDGSDRDSLERVQRLIARRGLVSKMRIVAAVAGL